MGWVKIIGASAIFAAACVLVPLAQSQPVKPKATPKLEAVAETKLLMEALADPNFKGLGKLFKEKPKDAEAWGYARGQALLIAETGNLLMMRPPKTKDSQDLWMTRAAELREAGIAMGRVAADKDYLKARAALADLANACNRCHKSFQVAKRVAPFPDE